MRVLSKSEYGKGGKITLHKVLKVVTNAGELDPNDVLLLNSNEIDDYKRWEERRYEIARDILANSHIAQQIGHYSYHEEDEVKGAVLMADLLIAELKGK